MSVQAVRNTTKYLFNSVDGKLLSTTTCFGPQVAIVRLALFGNVSTIVAMTYQVMRSHAPLHYWA
jgi:hypothetical protein